MYRRLSLLIAVGVMISVVSLSSCSKKDSASTASGSESASVSQSESTSSATSASSSSGSAVSAASGNVLTSIASAASKAGVASSAGTTSSKSNSKSSKVQSSTAAVSNGSKLSVKDMTAKSGDTISVPFSITAGSEIAAADVMVYFDSSVLKYDSYSVCSDFASGGSAINAANEISPGQLKLTFATLNPLMSATDMFTVKFKVNGKAGSKSNVTPKFETCCKEDTVTKLNIAVDAGSVTVK